MLPRLVRVVKTSTAVGIAAWGLGYVAPRMRALGEPTPYDDWGDDMTTVSNFDAFLIYSQLIFRSLSQITPQEILLWLNSSEAAGVFVESGGARLLLNLVAEKTACLSAKIDMNGHLQCLDMEAQTILGDIQQLLGLLEYLRAASSKFQLLDMITSEQWVHIINTTARLQKFVNTHNGIPPTAPVCIPAQIPRRDIGPLRQWSMMMKQRVAATFFRKGSEQSTQQNDTASESSNIIETRAADAGSLASTDGASLAAEVLSALNELLFAAAEYPHDSVPKGFKAPKIPEINHFLIKSWASIHQALLGQPYGDGARTARRLAEACAPMYAHVGNLQPSDGNIAFDVSKLTLSYDVDTVAAFPPHVQACLFAVAAKSVDVTSGNVIGLNGLADHFLQLVKEKCASQNDINAANILVSLCNVEMLRCEHMDDKGTGRLRRFLDILRVLPGATATSSLSDANLTNNLRHLAAACAFRAITPTNELRVEQCYAAAAASNCAAHRARKEPAHNEASAVHYRWCRKIIYPAILLLGASLASKNATTAPAFKDGHKSDGIGTAAALEFLASTLRHSDIDEHLLSDTDLLQCCAFSPVYSNGMNIRDVIGRVFLNSAGDSGGDFIDNAFHAVVERLLQEHTIKPMDWSKIEILPAVALDTVSELDIVDRRHSTAMNPSPGVMAKYTGKCRHAVQPERNRPAGPASTFQLSMVDPPEATEVQVFPSLLQALIQSLDLQGAPEILCRAMDAQTSSKSEESLKRYLAEVWVLGILHNCLSRLPSPDPVKVAAARELSRWYDRHRSSAMSIRTHAAETVTPLPLQRLHPKMQAKVVHEVHRLAMIGEISPLWHEAYLPPLSGSVPLEIHSLKSLAYLLGNSSKSIAIEASRSGLYFPLRWLMSHAAAECKDFAATESTDAPRLQSRVALLRQACRVAANATFLHRDPVKDSTLLQPLQEAMSVASNACTGDVKLQCTASRAAHNIQGPLKYGDMLFPLFDNLSADPNDGGLDIVLVHGLQGAALKTWRTKTPIGVMEGASEAFYKIVRKDGQKLAIWPVLWLAQDLVSEGIPCRIISVAYDAPMLTRSSIRPDRPLQDVATEAYQQLTAAGVGSRRTLFMAHSLGGLLTKQLLVGCMDAKLYNNLLGCVFYGVPHKGSNHAYAAVTVSQYFAPVHHYLPIKLPSITSSHVQHLGNKVKLDNLQQQFKELWTTKELLPASTFLIDFLEGKKTRLAQAAVLEKIGISWHDQLVVPPESGNSGLGQAFLDEESDHIRICKPASPLHPTYKLLKSEILKALRSGPAGLAPEARQASS